MGCFGEEGKGEDFIFFIFFFVHVADIFLWYKFFLSLAVLISFFAAFMQVRIFFFLL
jgi:hypothetical protein